VPKFSSNLVVGSPNWQIFVFPAWRFGGATKGLFAPLLSKWLVWRGRAASVFAFAHWVRVLWNSRAVRVFDTSPVDRVLSSQPQSIYQKNFVADGMASQGTPEMRFAFRYAVWRCVRGMAGGTPALRSDALSSLVESPPAFATRPFKESVPLIASMIFLSL
jgi:hypothetical protein